MSACLSILALADCRPSLQWTWNIAGIFQTDCNRLTSLLNADKSEVVLVIITYQLIDWNSIGNESRFSRRHISVHQWQDELIDVGPYTWCAPRQSSHIPIQGRRYHRSWGDISPLSKGGGTGVHENGKLIGNGIILSQQNKNEHQHFRRK